jgi:hypothetical protein
MGPERLSRRYEKDEYARRKSGCEDTTYKMIADQLEMENQVRHAIAYG